MADVMITDGIKQQVITRLATINSATSLLSLINGRPAKVSVDEVLDLAERIERWAWRGLLDERQAERTPEKPTPNNTSPEPNRDTRAPAGPPSRQEPKPLPARDNPPQSNGNGQHAGVASEKQINAIFAIGKSKGYASAELKEWVKGQFAKSVNALTSREASKLIGDLQAL